MAEATVPQGPEVAASLSTRDVRGITSTFQIHRPVDLTYLSEFLVNEGEGTPPEYANRPRQVWV